MMTACRKYACTTTAVHAEIFANNETARVLARRLGVTEQTIYKWKKFGSFVDRPHSAYHLLAKLTPARETIAVHLRRTLLFRLWLDVPLGA